MSEIQKNGAEIFQYLEENFTKNGFVQYRIQDIEHKFSGIELEALTKLFDNFQPGMGTQPQLPAVITLDEKDDAIAYLDKYLGEL